MTWIICTKSGADDLVKSAARRRAKLPRRAGRRSERVLTVAPPRPESLPTLRGLFPFVVGDSPAYKWLPMANLAEVLFEPALDRSELFIAVASDPGTQTISLIRGDYQQFVLPFSFFEPSGDGTT